MHTFFSSLDCGLMPFGMWPFLPLDTDVKLLSALSRRIPTRGRSQILLNTGEWKYTWNAGYV